MSTERDTQRVSETYRDIATETSPAHLDDKVMAMARQGARTRYGLARAWIRPVAWAATIGLSFAFILEMTYFSGDAPPVDAAMPTRADSDAREAAEPASEAPAFKRAPAAVVAAPEIKANELPALREAEERADEAAANYAEDIPAAQLRRERAAPQFADTAGHCDAEDRKDADAWYHCVLELRAEGLTDAAAAELGALREAFPDFREPVSE
mgnify:CR=1 FL=1|jgi:hypothetical protein